MVKVSLVDIGTFGAKVDTYSEWCWCLFLHGEWEHFFLLAVESTAPVRYPNPEKTTRTAEINMKAGKGGYLSVQDGYALVGASSGT